MTNRETAAGLAVAMTFGMAGAVYYYSTHLAGGRVEPKLYLRQLIGFAVMESVIGGVTSFFLYRAMRYRSNLIMSLGIPRG